MKLDIWQKAFLDTKGSKILCTGRQIGKSEAAAMDAIEWIMAHPNLGDAKPVVMIAPLEKQSNALMMKALEYAKRKYPGSIKMGRDKPTLERIRFKNGTTLECKAVGTGLNIRYLTISRLYIDEASRCSDMIYESVQPATLTTNADIILISTLNGAKGFFYNCWINKDEAWNNFARFAKSTEDAMREREVCVTWTQETKEGAIRKMEQAKSTMPEMVYAQEYLGIAMLDMSRFFSNELIEKCCILERRGMIIPGRRTYGGSDISGMGEDLTTIEIIEKQDKDILIHLDNIVSNRVYTTDTSDKIIFLHEKYRFKAYGVDSNGVGFGVFSELLRDRRTKDIAKDIYAQKRPLDADGEHSKTILKEQMYFRLLAWLEKGKIRLLKDQSVIESLKSIQFKLILEPGRPTRHEISGNDAHIVEGLIIAVWLATEDQSLNFFVR